MAELVTIARPYAQAVFDLAQQTNSLQTWSKALSTVAQVVTAPEVKKIIGNPKVNQHQVRYTLAEACKVNAPKELLSFLNVLVDSKRLIVLPQISYLFEELKAVAEKTVKAEMRSAFTVEKALQDAIETALKKRLGKEVDLVCQVDESLLGGAIIRAGDLVIDGSVTGQLSRLTTELTH